MAHKHRVLALVYAVPGIGWAVAALAVLLYHQKRFELPVSPFGWRLLGGLSVASGGSVHMRRRVSASGPAPRRGTWPTSGPDRAPLRSS